MIDKKYHGRDLIGQTCRPTVSLRNGGGHGVSRNTLCTIKDVVRGHGFIIETQECPHCGQYARISRVNRCDLELANESVTEDRAMILLQACMNLLDKQKDSPFVLNLLTETVFYDETDCDGYCLSDDIRDFLMVKGVLKE